MTSRQLNQVFTAFKWALCAIAVYVLSCVSCFAQFGVEQPMFAVPSSLPCNGVFPTNVANLVVWLQANNLVYKDNGVTLAVENDTVQLWADSSGSGNSVAQGTSGLRPTYHANVVNGLPAISFTNKVMDRTYSSALVHPCTYFIVYQVSTGIADPGYIYDGVGAAYSDNLFYSGGALVVNNNGDGGTLQLRPATVSKEVWFYDTMWYIGANSFCWTNGIPARTNTINNINATALRLGATRFPDQYGTFKIAELLVYNASVSWSDATNICCYLRTKYGL